MPEKANILRVDAASFYFVKGYEKAPEKCEFAKPTATECIAKTTAAKQLPEGWIEEKIPSRSKLEEEGRVDAFRMGILYSSLRHHAQMPKNFDNRFMEWVRNRLNPLPSSFQSSSEWQEEYNCLVADLHNAETKFVEAGDAMAKYEKEGQTIRQSKTPIDPKVLEKRMDEADKLDVLIYQSKQTMLDKEHKLWLFLSQAMDRGVEVLFEDFKEHSSR